MVTKNRQLCHWLNEHTAFIFLTDSSANKSITFLRSCPLSAVTGAERWPWTRRKVPNNSIHICLFVSSARVVNLARTPHCLDDYYSNVRQLKFLLHYIHCTNDEWLNPDPLRAPLPLREYTARRNSTEPMRNLPNRQVTNHRGYYPAEWSWVTNGILRHNRP
jgi:hypothetical protein